MEVELLSDRILTSPVYMLGVLRGLWMDQSHQSTVSTTDNILRRSKWEFVKIGFAATLGSKYLFGTEKYHQYDYNII